jgi:hypothetical protein
MSSHDKAQEPNPALPRMQQFPYENCRLAECRLLCLCVTPEEWRQIAVRRRALGFLGRWDVQNFIQ